VAGASLAYSWWALIPAGALAVLWALKAHVEERHLARVFPEYDEYRRRVRARFVPHVY
jgi:protein-S-isoprenylcysteine O-methyltransferase Ste14